jgi:hypothetical protein
LQKISTHHPDAVFLVPAGDLKLLSRKKIKNAFEFEWWESFKVII